jgi:hypothetical protein
VVCVGSWYKDALQVSLQVPRPKTARFDRLEQTRARILNPAKAAEAVQLSWLSGVSLHTCKQMHG